MLLFSTEIISYFFIYTSHPSYLRTIFGDIFVTFLTQDPIGVNFKSHECYSCYFLCMLLDCWSLNISLYETFKFTIPSTEDVNKGLYIAPEGAEYYITAKH